MGEDKEEKKKKFMGEFMDDDDKDDDPEQIAKILTVVSEKVPALLNSLADVLYGKDRAAQYGKAVAAFYKELRDAGMSDQQAYTLTQEYMSAMNIGKMMGGALGGHGHGPGGGDFIDGEEMAKEINDKMKQKIELKLQKKFADKKDGDGGPAKEEGK